MNNKMINNCKLCESDNLQIWYTSRQSNLPIMHCAACGLFFVGRVFTSAEQKEYYGNFDDYLHFVEAERRISEVGRRHVAWLEQIQQLIPADFAKAEQRKLRLLDIGCGAGDFLAMARKQGFEVYGLELSAPAAQLATEYYNIQVDLQDIADDPREGFFDVVTLIGLLEHVIDPRDMLRHAHRLLSSNGILFIYTPVWGKYDFLASFLARASRNRFTRLIDRRINQAHLQIFPKTTLINLLEELGLETLSCEALCEYNLPITEYFQSIGITQAGLQSIVAKSVKALIDRQLFFYNNMRVIARKPAELPLNTQIL